MQSVTRFDVITSLRPPKDFKSEQLKLLRGFPFFFVIA